MSSAPIPLNTGNDWSKTIMVCDAVELFPHSSVAVNVRVIVYSFAQLPGIVSSSKVRLALPQASIVVGSLNSGVAGQAIVASSPTPSISGAVLSTTVIACEALLLLPHQSVTVHSLIIVYSFGQLPAIVSSLISTVGFGSQRSDTVISPKYGSLGHSIKSGTCDTVTSGGIRSSTVIVCEAVELLPHASLAVHVRTTL